MANKANLNPSNITVALLAGGLGTRLRKVVSGRPKALADVRGRPFLSYLLDQIADFKFKHVVLCTGYLGQQVQELYGDRYGSLHIKYSQETEPLGTGGAVRKAVPLFESESILLLNGDSFIKTNLLSFVEQHREKCSNASLLLVKATNTRKYGRVNIDKHNRVINFHEKGDESGAGWINAGAYLIELKMLKLIPAFKSISLEREILPSWIGKGIHGFKRRASFIDIGTPENLTKAHGFFG